MRVNGIQVRLPKAAKKRISWKVISAVLKHFHNDHCVIEFTGDEVEKLKTEFTEARQGRVFWAGRFVDALRHNLAHKGIKIGEDNFKKEGDRKIHIWTDSYIPSE